MSRSQWQSSMEAWQNDDEEKMKSHGRKKGMESLRERWGGGAKYEDLKSAKKNSGLWNAVTDLSLANQVCNQVMINWLLLFYHLLMVSSVSLKQTSTLL